jgi:pyruvate carboxylase
MAPKPETPVGDDEQSRTVMSRVLGAIVKVTPTTRVVGDPLVSIDAMKIETQNRAERDGTVRTVRIRSGETIAARALPTRFPASG